MIFGGEYRKSTLDSGLRVVTDRVPHVRSVSLGVWVQVGCRDEEPVRQGISHFLEHMLFKGTARRDAFEIANSLESVGGSLDAFAYRDLTCYYARCLDENLAVALDVLADLVQNPRLCEEEIVKEKQIVLEEIQNIEDTPDDLIHDLFARSIWGDPVGQPILGTPETVRSFTSKDLRRHLETHYRLDRMVVTAAGNLDHDDLVERASRLFLSRDFGELYKRVQPPDIPRENRHFSKDIGQMHICLGSAAYSYTHPRQYDLMIANTALGGGMTSRLFQQVRERLGLAYAAYSYLESLEDTGLFGTYVACDRSRSNQLIDVVRRELEKFRLSGLNPEELDSCKAQLRGELILGFESMDQRMSRIAWEEIYTGKYEDPESVLRSINAVSGEGVLSACSSLLEESRLHLITVGPE